MIFFTCKFFPKCTRTRIFSCHIFPAHFVGFLFPFFLAFSFVFSTLLRKWRRTLFLLELKRLFLRYSVHLAKEIVKLLKKSERWENKWSRVKTLQDKQSCRWPGVFFHKLCEKCYRKSCKYIRNTDSTRLQGKKKTSTSQYQSFEHNGMEICDQQRLNSLKRKKAVHISCRHGIRRICKLYTKGRPAGKLTWCESSSNHLDYRWWGNIQTSSPQNTGLAKTATTLHLGNCEFRHAMGARTFYTSPLRKCQKS